jgi:hypothetical protein
MNLLKRLTELRAMLMYVYLFIVRDVRKNTAEVMHRVRHGKGSNLPCPLGAPPSRNLHRFSSPGLRSLSFWGFLETS